MIQNIVVQYRTQHAEIKKQLSGKIELGMLKINAKWDKRVAKSVEHPIFGAAKFGYDAGISSKKGGYSYILYKQEEEPTSITFTFGNPDVERWLDDFTIQFASSFNARLQGELNDIVKFAINEGGTVEQIRLQIQNSSNTLYRNIYGEKGDELLTAWRARRIAQTETNTAQNAGHLAGLVDSGVVEFKGWLSARNAKVREDHKHADKTYNKVGIPLAENFIVGTGNKKAFLSAPGILVSGNIGQRINCHCILVATERGKRRGGTSATSNIPTLRKPRKRKKRVKEGYRK